ncbi:MAG: hypothetical protein JWN78_2514 [Bacteroidota bacterium]|nr:hypothetical protein [Bacteroidota bacterium]
MKTTIKISLLFAAFYFVAGNFTMAQDKPFKDGTVWQLSFIKSKPNMGEEYLKGLSATWKKVHDEAIKQGLLVSYKILSGEASNPGDWDILLMEEFKNMAAMEGQDAKWDAIMTSVVGNQDQQKALSMKRVEIRDIYGGKMMRELVYK